MKLAFFHSASGSRGTSCPNHFMARTDCLLGGGAWQNRPISAKGMLNKATELLKKGKIEDAKGLINDALGRGLDGRLEKRAYFLMGVAEYLDVRLRHTFGNPGKDAYAKAKGCFKKAGEGARLAPLYLKLIEFHEKYEIFSAEIWKDIAAAYNPNLESAAGRWDAAFEKAGLEKDSPLAVMCKAQHCYIIETNFRKNLSAIVNYQIYNTTKNTNGLNLNDDAPKMLREAKAACKENDFKLVRAEALFQLVVLESKDGDIVELVRESPYHSALLMKHTRILCLC